MQEFELYKKLAFSDYVSDTITFLRTYGKHYFSNYFKVNGAFLIILSALIFFLSKSYVYIVLERTESIRNGVMSPDVADENFMVGLSFIIMMFVMILLSLVSVTYTVIYLGLFEKHRDTSFTSREIWKGFKKNLWRMFLFFFISLLTIVPLTIFLVVVFYVREIALILLPLVIILAPAFLSWVSVSYYTYLLEDKGYFAALTRGFEIIRNKFWPIIGSTLIISLIVKILQSAVTMIPYALAILGYFLTIDNEAPPTESFGYVSLVAAMVFVITVFAGYFLDNMLVVHQGIIYYTAQENEFNNAAHLEIDNIGTGVE